MTSKAYFTGAMNDSETTGPGEYRRNSLLTHCFISQNPAILFLILWPAAALSLMYAFSLSENVNPLILRQGRQTGNYISLLGPSRWTLAHCKKAGFDIF